MTVLFIFLFGIEFVYDLNCLLILFCKHLGKKLDSKHRKLLLCGENLIDDKTLNSLLKPKYDITCLKDFLKLFEIVTREAASLIIFEITEQREKQLKILKDLKSKLPDVIVLVTNGSDNVHNATEILNAGASDVFPSPYNVKLLADRVDGLLR